MKIFYTMLGLILFVGGGITFIAGIKENNMVMAACSWMIMLAGITLFGEAENLSNEQGC